MHLLLQQILFRLPESLPSQRFSLSIDYDGLRDQWCDAVFARSSGADRHLNRQHANRVIARARNFWSIVLDILPKNVFEKGPDCWGIAESRWQEWLESLWGCDGDAICLIGCPDADPADLPVVWAPVISINATHDAHVHLSALPPNSLLWGTIIALGVTGDSGSGSMHSAFANTPPRPRLKEIVRLARVILNTLRHLCATAEADLPRGLLSIYGDARTGIGTASMAELTLKFLSAFPLLRRAVFDDAVVCSDCFGVPTAMAMLVEERRIIQQTLSRCRNARSDLNWWVDLLVLYWQCKGEWLTSIQGEAQQANASLIRFKAQMERAKSFAPKELPSPGDGLRRRFDQLLTSGVNALISKRKTRLRVDLRIALIGVAELRTTSMWLESGLSGAETRLFVGLKRRDDCIGRGDREFAITEDSIDVYFENLAKFDNIRSRICGIDVFGFEATTCWSDYLPLMRHASDHVSRIAGDCVISFHCGEDPVCSLKGILDMWRVVNEFHNAKECRIAHALALLAPQSYEIKTPIDHRIWGEMQLAANRLFRYANRVDKLRDRGSQLEEVWEAVEKTAMGGQLGVCFPSSTIRMEDLFERFRVVITEDLISRGVIIEVCPTSNWRIGHVSSPLKHPISYWHERGGKWLVGTDDPCFIPCSVESEFANVTLSLR